MFRMFITLIFVLIGIWAGFFLYAAVEWYFPSFWSILITFISVQSVQIVGAVIGGILGIVLGFRVGRNKETSLKLKDILRGFSLFVLLIGLAGVGLGVLMSWDCLFDSSFRDSLAGWACGVTTIFIGAPLIFAFIGLAGVISFRSKEPRSNQPL